jgi:UDP-N-acetylmuramoyl-L-alanyl-D-glutamate--2,6-diaminopimelate ligase
VPHAFDPEHLRPAPLRSVAAAVGASEPGTDALVTGMTVSTGDVRPGVLFAALPGRHQHGADHVETARRAGAVAVLTDTAGESTARAGGLPVVVVSDVRPVLGAAARAVYGTADLGVPMLGVTGTNGKTSTVYVLDA